MLNLSEILLNYYNGNNALLMIVNNLLKVNSPYKFIELL